MLTTPEAGDRAPDFTLPRDGGGTVGLSDLAGRWAVIYFYPKDDTSGCTSEAIDFSERLDAFRDLGVEVIGISPDSVARHDRFKAKHGLSVLLASDEDHAVSSAYGVWKEKSMYGRKFMGIERSTFLIDPEGRLARAWRRVRVPGHAEEVLRTAGELIG